MASRPQAIAKNELHERVWPGTFITDATLASVVAELRDALGEKGRAAQFIRTVHGFGYAFAAAARDEDSPPPASARAWLVYDGREVSLYDGENTLGRDAHAAVALRSSSVSRRHARITIRADAAVLEDLRSKNGTYLRNRRLTSPTPLVDGDQIRIGACKLTFRTFADPGSTESVV